MTFHLMLMFSNSSRVKAADILLLIIANILLYISAKLQPVEQLLVSIFSFEMNSVC